MLDTACTLSWCSHVPPLCTVCCRGQDFEKAGSLRDKEMELKAQISKITNEAKESEQAEVESGDQTGPLVTEADIANIVAQWTGLLLLLLFYPWDLASCVFHALSFKGAPTLGFMVLVFCVAVAYASFAASSAAQSSHQVL